MRKEFEVLAGGRTGHAANYSLFYPAEAERCFLIIIVIISSQKFPSSIDGK